MNARLLSGVATLLLALTAPVPAARTSAQPPPAVYTEAALDLGEPRPCIPEAGQQACDATRTALWNGEAAAWRARGITDPDARFNETVVFRVQAGDPAAIRNIARVLGWPYVKIARLRFIGTEPEQGDEFVEVTNLGGGAQDMSTWVIEPPQAIPVSVIRTDPRIPPPTPLFPVLRFQDGLILQPGQSCRFYTGLPERNTCSSARPAFGSSGIWPDAGGSVLLRFTGLNLPGDFTRYSADPASQPPAPNLQGVEPSPATSLIGAEFTLSASKEVYAQCEPVEFRILLRNAGSAPLELTFNTSQRFDVTVSSEGGGTGWQWAGGKLFPQMVSTITLAPGESTSYAATWDPHVIGGVAGQGTYRARAVLTTADRPVSNVVTFRIGPPPALPGGAAGDIPSLIDVLRAAGATVAPVSDATPSFLSVPRIAILVNGEEVQVFQYSCPIDADADAARVSPDGYTITRASPDGRPMGAIAVDWVAPPHFFKQGRIIVLYLGRNDDLLRLLAAVLGPQFAGG